MSNEESPEWSGLRTKTIDVALLILNSKYKSSKYEQLPKVVEDGKMMKTMLTGYEIHPFSDVNDIGEKIATVLKKTEDTKSKIGRLHFHFSGHGVNNRKIEIPRTEELLAVSNTSDGECLVGITGDKYLYSVHDLKHELLKFKSTTITITLDCCRSQNRGNSTVTKNPEKVQTVLLKHKGSIRYADELKIAVLYASLDLHSVYDSMSLTKELAKVTQKGTNPIPITKIASKVNMNWKTIQQGCKDDFFEVGNNWTDFYWPKLPKEKKCEEDSNQSQEEDSNQSEEENSNHHQETTPTTPPWAQALAQELMRGSKRVEDTVEGMNMKITTIEKDVSVLKQETHKITLIEKELNNLKKENSTEKKIEEAKFDTE